MNDYDPSAPPPRQPSVGLTLFGLGMIGGALALWSGSQQHARDVQAGPKPVEPAEISKARDPDELPSRYVMFKPTKVYNPGVRRTLTRKGVPIGTRKFVLVQVEDRFLIAELRGGEPVLSRMTGYLMTRKSDDYRDVIADMYARVPACRDKLLPFQMDCVIDQKGQAAWRWPVLGFFVLGGLLFLFVGAVGVPAHPRAGPQVQWGPTGRNFRVGR
jgi:hypothetical protein